MQPQRGRSRYSPWVVWLLLGVILAGASLIRWRLRDCPLERDEGEYAYIGRLILEGVAPYGTAGNHKFPGAYLAYAAIMAVFGQTIAGIHLGMLVVNLANTLLVFFLGRRMSGNVVGLTAAASWALMSVSGGVMGNAAHLTHFVMLAVLSGILLLLSGLETARYRYLIAAGTCLGISIMFRQTSLIFVAFGVIYLWFTARQSRAKQTAILLGASTLPLILMALWLWLAGVFPQFWRWTITEAAAYGSQLTLAEGLRGFPGATLPVIGWFWLIWIGGAIGLGLAVARRSARDWLVIGLFLAGLVALSAGFYFRQHYYVQVLPAIALFFGIAIERAWRWRGQWRYLAVIGAAIALAVPLVAQRNYFCETNPIALARYLYGASPFPEAIEVARYVHENSDPGQPVAILGSEPEIFFYSQRRSATTLLYTYPLMEHHRFAHAMQAAMAREIEEKSPKFVIFVNVRTSWLPWPDSDQFIFEWARKFLAREYQLDGVADILAEGSQYVWGSAARSYHPRSPYTVNVYRRVGD
jgi:hypothetical protein